VSASIKNLLKSKPARASRRSKNQWEELVKADIHDQLLPHHLMKMMTKTFKVLKNYKKKPKEACYYCFELSISSSLKRDSRIEGTPRAFMSTLSLMKQNKAKDKPITAL
jgi:hypothetical protein